MVNVIPSITAAHHALSRMSQQILVRMVKSIQMSDSVLLDELLKKNKNIIWNTLTTFVHDSTFKENIQGLTLLHIAANESESKCISTILSNVTQEERSLLCNMLEEGENRRIALHTALDGGCRCQICTSKKIECLNILIAGGSDINAKDQDGDTPLVYTVMYMMPECASVLLERGADANIKILKLKDRMSKSKAEPIVLYEYIAQKIPSALTALLDKGIAVDKIDSSILCLDFKVVLPDHENEEEDGTPVYISKNESSMLSTMASAHLEGKKKLLTHPMTLAFIHFKWTLVQRYIFCIQFFYVLMTILFSWFVINTFGKFTYGDEKDENLTDSSIISSNPLGKKYKLKSEANEDKPLNPILAGCVCVWCLIMILNEVYEISLGFKKYVKVPMNFGWWILFICVGVSVAPGFGLELQLWQLPIASFAVFLSWGLSLIQTSRFPSLGIYIEMIGKVIFDFFVFLMTFSSLLIGFTLAFNVLFPQDQMFSNVGTSFVKIILMMTGESNYEITFENIIKSGIDVLPLEYAIPAHIIFLGFIFIITIVLMNLSIGLAVTDIQELKNVSMVRKVQTQIEQIQLFETMTTKLFPHIISGWIKKKISILNILKDFDTESSTSIKINPTDPEDTTFGNDLRELFIPYVLGSRCIKDATMKQCVNSELNEKEDKKMKAMEDSINKIHDTLRKIQETLSKMQ